MSRLNINNLTNENEDGSPKISGISTFSSTHYFVPPSGTTAERPSHADPGMIRFNTDSGHLEYYNGVEWTSVIVNNYQVGISTNAAGTSGGLGTRGLFGGGIDPGATPVALNTIDYITTSTLGNAIDFGLLTAHKRSLTACSSSTRGLFAGGYSSPTPALTRLSAIDFVTISSTGNAQSFGNLSVGKANLSACSNSTRGIFAGGYRASPSVSLNTIEYVTISSTGTISDFGDLNDPTIILSACSSSVRGIFSGGLIPGPTVIDTIQYVTINSTGNAQDFGDLSIGRQQLTSCSNSTRGVFGGGEDPSSITNLIDFVTIATTGNAQEFGDLTLPKRNLSACSSSTRGIFGGGLTPTPTPTIINQIEYITILSTGNSQDFGDLSATKHVLSSCSNGHGGL